MRRATTPTLLAGLLSLVLYPTASAVSHGQRRSTAASPATAAPRRAASRPRVGNIRDTSEVSRTVSCGFYFQFPTKEEGTPSRYVFISQVNGEDAWMNLDGRDTRLRLVRISPYPRERLGARRRIDYRAPGGYKVLVRTVVDAVSDENNYEPTRFRVTLTVSRGRARTHARAVGYAGC